MIQEQEKEIEFQMRQDICPHCLKEQIVAGNKTCIQCAVNISANLSKYKYKRECAWLAYQAAEKELVKCPNESTKKAYIENQKKLISAEASYNEVAPLSHYIQNNENDNGRS